MEISTILDHDQVFFGRFAIPVMVRYMDKHQRPLDEKERDKMLFWFLQAGMWGNSVKLSPKAPISRNLCAGWPANLAEQLNFWVGLSQRLKQRLQKSVFCYFFGDEKSNKNTGHSSCEFISQCTLEIR